MSSLISGTALNYAGGGGYIGKASADGSGVGGRGATIVV